MVNAADVVVCDSVNIEKYIQEEYQHPHTTFIAYGSDTVPSVLADDDPKFTDWLQEKGLRAGEYYLVVGRFVPENNYETMIREFMQSHSGKDFAIITNMNDKLKEYLESTLHFSADPRIKFVGTVYDKELLKKSVDKFLLGRLLGTTSVAIYGVGGQINSLYLQFSSSVSNVFVPKVNRIVAEHRSDEELSDVFVKVGSRR